MDGTSNVRLSASIMCADFKNLEMEVKEIEGTGVEMIHFDVNDGQFTPILTMGPTILSSIRPLTTLPIEVHLQIRDPARHVEAFARAGAQMIIFHIESCIDVFRNVRMARENGLSVGVALNPVTPLCYLDYLLDEIDLVLIMTVDAGLVGQQFIEATLRKIADLRRMMEDRALVRDIEVDGCINTRTAPAVVGAGANVLVLGSSGLFGAHTDKKKAVREIREKIGEAFDATKGSD